MNKEEIRQAREVIDAVRKGEPLGGPLQAAFPQETSAPAPDNVRAFLTKWRDGSISQQKFLRQITHSGTTTAACILAESYAAHWKAEAERLRLNQEADAILIYSKATGTAMLKGQTVGEQNDYYITLAQLENIIAELRRSRGTDK